MDFINIFNVLANSLLAVLCIRFFFINIEMLWNTKIIASITRVNLFNDLLKCSWCFSFWTSLVWGVASATITGNWYLLLIWFIVPPLNNIIDGIVE